MARRLRRHGVRLATRPASFFVTKQNRTIDGELARAERWGSELISTAARPVS